MNDDEQLRFETEMGNTQVWFYEQRVEETRSAMLEARHQFWLKARAPADVWLPIQERYWAAVDNWHDAQNQLLKAKKEVRDATGYH